MTGIPTSLATHKLNIDPEVKPIRQKKRTFAPERAEAINTEVQKLVAADILKLPFFLQCGPSGKVFTKAA